MKQLAVERIKLFSTPTAWICTGLTIAMMVGLATLGSMGDAPAHISVVNMFSQFGMMIMMVLSALAVTTEYRFSTIRTTFQAVPNRATVALAKAAVVMLVALIVGEIAAFGSWGMALTLAPPGSELALAGPAEWRQVAGVGLLFMVGSLYGVAIGFLLRHSAGAVALVLLWPLLLENLIGQLPQIGESLINWMPFNVAGFFLVADGKTLSTLGWAEGLSPWVPLGYFALIGTALLAVAMVTINRRDA